MIKTKNALTLVLLIIMGLTVILVVGMNAKDYGKYYLIINETKIYVEVMRNPEEVQKGLSFRPSIAQDHGMLFAFEEMRQWEFWMYGMQFPLDFVWINNNRVADLSENILEPAKTNGIPQRLQPKSDVNYVLEVNAGWIKQNKIKIGDKVEFKI